MKNQLTRISFVALALFASISIQAKTNFCDNTLKSICIDTFSAQTARDLRISKLKKEISAEANAKAAPRIEEMKKRVPWYRFFRRGLESIKIRNKEIILSARARMGKIETVITNDENVQKVKGYLIEAIQNSSLESDIKDDFSETVKSVVVGNFGDFIDRMDLENSLMAQLFANHCGSDGMVSNAFATVMDNQKYVLVCPGFLITLNAESTDEEKLDSVFQVLTHELAHHIDTSSKGPEAYLPYLNCVVKNHSANFNRTSSDEKLCTGKKKVDAVQCLVSVTKSHAGELIADMWGVQATLNRFKDRNYTVAQKEKMLTETWVNLCGSKDEGIHPSGDFRIGMQLRHNPEVIEALGCGYSAPQTPYSCTFEGEVDVTPTPDPLDFLRTDNIDPLLFQ